VPACTHRHRASIKRPIHPHPLEGSLIKWLADIPVAAMSLRQNRGEARLRLRGPGYACCLPDDFIVARAPVCQLLPGLQGARIYVHTGLDVGLGPLGLSRWDPFSD
jgi:hypothetical protein